MNVQNGGVPDYTSLYKRAKNLDVAIKVQHKTGKLDVAVDSTGLKVYGEGERKAPTHGKSKRRTWRKIHWTIDSKTQAVRAVKITENSVDDAAVVPQLLDQIDGEIERFLGDSGYDKRNVYRTLSTRKIQPCIPPRKNTKLDLKEVTELPENIATRRYGRRDVAVRRLGNVESVIIVGRWRKPQCFV